MESKVLDPINYIIPASTPNMNFKPAGKQSWESKPNLEGHNPSTGKQSWEAKLGGKPSWESKHNFEGHNPSIGKQSWEAKLAWKPGRLGIKA